MSTQNRLNLDWKLSTRKERNLFATTYLETLPNPTQDELDMIAKYILWGTNSEGLNGRQEGLDLPTRSHIWDSAQSNFESLDALLESPTFNENIIRKPEDPVFKTPKVKLNRSQIRTSAPDHLQSSFEELWEEIDKLELLVTLYELAHGKRTKPAREELISRISTEDYNSITIQASHLNAYDYLKKKRLLIEKRREQYTLKDGYTEPLLMRPTFSMPASTQITWGEDIEIKPIGLPYKSRISDLVFREDRFPEPDDFKEEDLEELSKFLWSAPSSPNSLTFDFREVEHIGKLAAFKEDLEEEIQRESLPLESTLPQLLQVWKIYVNLAPLKDFQRLILELKIKHKTNEEVISEVWKQFGKKYTPNYISTMYCKSILPTIADTARRHREIVENLFFPENFKKCIDCGRVLLRDNENFVKKSRSSDGFSPRCKKCEKILRDSRKEKQK